MIVIFVEFIDQLIDYPINRASLTKYRILYHDDIRLCSAILYLVGEVFDLDLGILSACAVKVHCHVAAQISVYTRMNM